MKNTILLFCFILSFQVISAQTNSFLDEGNIWNIAFHDGWTFSISTISYRLSGDTLIGEQTYKKIQKSGDSLNLNWEYTNEFIREDSLGRIVKFDPRGDKIKYDFNLSVGDTFRQEDYCVQVVTHAIDILFRDGQVRKMIYLADIDSGYNFDVWVEGIGSLDDHPFRSGTKCFFDGLDPSLTCFHRNGELLYPSVLPNSCFINETYADVEELQTISEIKIYPNPSQNDLFIESETTKLQRFAIYDLTGKLIQRGEINAFKTRIDLSNFQKGYYLLVLEDKAGKSYSQKLIKF